MSTHKAIVTVAVRAPLEIIKVPTVRPVDREVRVRQEWTSSSPLDLHQNDSGLLVKHPQILGARVGGTVVEVGPTARNLKIGDQVSEALC
jgi:Zn-dependent alcohol dehydrogenase